MRRSLVLSFSIMALVVTLVGGSPPSGAGGAQVVACPVAPGLPCGSKLTIGVSANPAPAGQAVVSLISSAQTLDTGAAVTFSGELLPRHPGEHVTIQQRIGTGGWRGIARV